jgi:UDP-N-acetyl-D-mannosaminuronate dehydrogenase
MVHLVIGFGEVGKSLFNILQGEKYWLTRHDGTWKDQPFDVMHICIPYNENTKDDFKKYIQMGKDKSSLIIVHSSTPVGTCDGLGVIHSPIHGVHPHLEEGIKTFPKTFGGLNKTDIGIAAMIFEQLGIKTRTYENARTTEALKLWSTTQYGRMIMLEKEIYEWCQENDVDFDAVYTQHNQDYNEAYLKLGRPDVVRPWLKHIPGPIGGHCVLPNAKLLKIKL